MKTLAEIMLYQNEHVLKRYEQEFPDNKLTAQAAFQELLKYFWLSTKHHLDQSRHPGSRALDFSCGIHFEMKEIDDMWHTFLLFTKDYAEFSEVYFGKFVHHQPNVKEAKPSADEFEQSFKRFASYVYDHLGQETLEVWFAQLLKNE